MSEIAVDAFFIGSGIDRRFAVLTSPPGKKSSNALLFVPPFAEELNKSRRMVALTARALATHGYSVLQLDPYGCGDSAGDFADATWDGWVSDIAMAHGWLRRHTGLPVSLWALRAGALLAFASLPRLDEVPRLLLWQPVLSGAQFLRQFLRLKVANAVLAGGSGTAGTKALLQELASGAMIEVAGYELAPALALGLDAAGAAPPATSTEVIWLEVNSAAPATPAPASLDRIQSWSSAGIRVTASAVNGPQFWQTQEIEECPALVEATVSALRGA